jgi:hypothetical protein
MERMDYRVCMNMRYICFTSFVSELTFSLTRSMRDRLDADQHRLDRFYSRNSRSWHEVTSIRFPLPGHG